MPVVEHFVDVVVRHVHDTIQLDFLLEQSFNELRMMLNEKVGFFAAFFL